MVELTYEDKVALRHIHSRMLNILLSNMQRPTPEMVQTSVGEVTLMGLGDVIFDGRLIWNTQEST